MQPIHKPILCYVTDGRSLVGSTTLRESIRRAAAAGVDWIQIREKDLAAHQLANVVRLAIADTQETGTRILVNDRLDVALAAGALGVHLGETSLPVGVVRQWRRSSNRADFLIGASCHSAEAAFAAERDGADYIFLGPVFATPSKAEFGPPQGIDRLREICAVINIPALAIGGITAENAASCVEAGAAGVAAIRLFQESGDIAAVVEQLAGMRQKK